ncbi:MAG TPA: hypothetical protein VGA36_05055, partial [Nitriliruptorales bacterium]
MREPSTRCPRPGPALTAALALLVACGAGAPSLSEVLRTSRDAGPVEVAYRYVENVIGTEVEVTGRGMSNLDDRSAYCYEAARSLAFPNTASGELERGGASLAATGELGRLVDAGEVDRLLGGADRLQLGSPEFVWWLLENHADRFGHTGTVEGADGELLHYVGRLPPTVPGELLAPARATNAVELVDGRLDVWADRSGRLARLTLRV